MQRLHAMLVPNRTACGVLGRPIKIGKDKKRKRLVFRTAADRTLMIAEAHEPVTCLLCIVAMERRGPPLPWPIKAASRRRQYLKGFRIPKEKRTTS